MTQFVDLDVGRLFISKHNPNAIYRVTAHIADKDGAVDYGCACQVASFQYGEWSFVESRNIERWNPYGECHPIKVTIEVQK